MVPVWFLGHYCSRTIRLYCNNTQKKQIADKSRLVLLKQYLLFITVNEVLLCSLQVFMNVLAIHSGIFLYSETGMS